MKVNGLFCTNIRIWLAHLQYHFNAGKVNELPTWHRVATLPSSAAQNLRSCAEVGPMRNYCFLLTSSSKPSYKMCWPCWRDPGLFQLTATGTHPQADIYWCATASKVIFIFNRGFSGEYGDSPSNCRNGQLQVKPTRKIFSDSLLAHPRSCHK